VTNEKERQYRRLARVYLRKLGVDPDEVAKQYPQLAAGKSGKRKKGNDEAFLEGLELHVRNWRKQTGHKRRTALRLIAGGLHGALTEDAKKKLAVSAESLADRWEKKLRAGGYDKRKFSTLKSRGVFVPMLWALSPPEEITG